MNSPFTTTITVWKALFLRQALERLFSSRAAWAWLVIEPAAHIGFFATVYSLRGGQRIGGADTTLWIIAGMLAFFLFQRTAVQTLHSIDSNRAYFAFRQVRPFDVALARAGTEGFSMFFVSLFILVVAGLWGVDVLPDRPLLLLLAFSGMWLFGLGYGLITSVCMRLVQDTGHIFQIMMMPLYILSGVFMPVSTLPHPYRDWLLLNPLAHGLDLARMGLMNEYVARDVSLAYLYAWVLGLISLGLLLYWAFETRLVTQ